MRLYNQWLSSGDIMSSHGDEWKDNLIQQLAEMFKGMNMPFDENMIRNMMEQFTDQFEQMGIDPEKLGSIDMKVDMKNFAKAFSGGADMTEIFSNLGFNVEVNSPPVEVDVDDTQNNAGDEVITLPEADWHLDGWNMCMTIDCNNDVTSDDSELNFSIVNGGSLLEISLQDNSQPFTRIKLAHPCESVIENEMNNGILDVILKLMPQGSALDDDENGDSKDRNIPIE